MNLDTVAIDPTSAATFPAQDPSASQLKPAHIQRLRFVFSKGRPIHCSQMSQFDLDLCAWGLLANPTREVDSLSYSGALAITERGVAVLKMALDKRRAVCDVHHSLGGRLAYWLRESRARMTWENATFHRDRQARCALNDIEGWSEARLDVVAAAITPTARLSDLATYEVKISVADFKADLAKPTKMQASRDIAQTAWYCTPDGLIDQDMVPKDFGLICEVAPGEFVIRKRAKRKRDFIPHPDTLMALIRRRATLPESHF
jgi:hypothetical protein